MSPPLDAPADLPVRLLARGVSSFTVADAARDTGQSPGAVLGLLKRLRDRGDVVSPARGFYLPVAPGHRAWGAPPALEFIDAMMRHLHRQYYVGLLTAAELHGIAHQRPQVFQVVVDRQVENRKVGRAQLRFHTSEKVGRVPTVSRQTKTGTVTVATPETTALDLAFRPAAGGGLDNVATVLVAMVEDSVIDLGLLSDASHQFPASAVRRVGWILDHIAALDAHGLLDPTDKEPTKLDPHGDRAGHIDPVWRVIVNADVVPDL